VAQWNRSFREGVREAQQRSRDASLQKVEEKAVHTGPMTFLECGYG
jgi:hypothetical protein